MSKRTKEELLAYKERKGISFLSPTPTILFVVFSNRKSVEEVKTSKIVNIKDGIYFTDNHEVEIKGGAGFGYVEGYGTGIGDLWGWTYAFFLVKEEADEYKKRETIRIEDAYASTANQREYLPAHG